MNRQLIASDFRSRPVRVHDFLQDVPLEDVWAIPLRGGGPSRTMRDLRPLFGLAELQAANPLIKWLFWLRWRVGTLLRWDQDGTYTAESYVHRLTLEDRSRSVIPVGSREEQFEPFTTLYVFEHEQLSEIRNATVHAFMSLSLEPALGGYLAYMAVYVKPVSPYTRLYMTAIAPFRHFLVYPALIRSVQRSWAERYGVAKTADATYCTSATV